MSSQINRLLLTTCLPVMALSLSVAPLSARAGFEWTPPEKAAEEIIMPDVPAPVVKGDALPAADAPQIAPSRKAVVPSEMPQQQPTAQQSGTPSAPKLKVKVLAPQKEEDQAKAPVQEEKKPVPTAAPQPAPAPQQQAQPQKSDFLPMPDEHNAAPQHAAKPHPQENVTAPVAAVEKPAAPVAVKEEVKAAAPAPAPEATAPTPQDGEVKINPFPLQAGKQPAKAPEKTVVLPKDSEQTSYRQPFGGVKSEEPAAKPDIAWNENTNFPVVESFGKDIPLAMALGQIVPAQYAYSFGAGVNPGVAVSWDGGKPWNEVLQSAIAPHGLGMKIEGNKLALFSTLKPSVPAAIAQPLPLPVKEEAAASAKEDKPEPKTEEKKASAPKAEETKSAEKQETGDTQSLQAQQLSRITATADDPVTPDVAVKNEQPKPAEAAQKKNRTPAN